MRLLSFRINNFRSIIDSREIVLSKDNVNVLIGQNESGKTSILEGLYSMLQKQKVSKSDIRDLESFPEITCKFKLDNLEELESIFNENEKILIKEILSYIKKKELIITLIISYDLNKMQDSSTKE